MLPTKTREAFEQTKEYLYKHIGSQRGVTPMAAWAMSTWIVGQFDRVEGLCLRQPINGTGTSTILNAVGSICMKPIYAAQMTDNAILRALNDGCTLLVDDYSFGNEKMDVILSIGFARNTAMMFKAVDVGNGEVRIEKNNVFGMKMIVAHGPISRNPSIASKFLQITIRKPGAGRVLAHINESEQRRLQNQLSDWAASFPRKMWTHKEFMYWLEREGE